VLVFDEDTKEHDFMLAGIVYYPDNVDDVTIDAIEKHVQSYLESLRRNGQLSAGPAAGEPVALRAARDCSDKVCFLDELAGIAGVRINLSPPVTPGVKCSAATISGVFGWETAPQGAVRFHFDEQTNSCSGAVTFQWNFGHGSEADSSQTAISHVFEMPGDYKVTVIPVCAQRARSCQAAPVVQTIEIK
jgi:hypothetical protein